MSYGRFCILQLLTVLDLAKNLIGFITKYAVDATLFRLGSSVLKHAGPRGADQKKILLSPDKCKSDEKNIYIFFFKNFQIYMKDTESIKSK